MSLHRVNSTSDQLTAGQRQNSSPNTLTSRHTSSPPYLYGQPINRSQSLIFQQPLNQEGQANNGNFQPNVCKSAYYDIQQNHDSKAYIDHGDGKSLSKNSWMPSQGVIY